MFGFLHNFSAPKPTTQHCMKHSYPTNRGIIVSTHGINFFSFTTLLCSLFLTALALSNAIAQTPTIAWEQSYGGTSDEINYVIQQTSDGGFMSVGRTFSNDGDVFDALYLRQAWIMKVDATGNLMWQKSFGGSDTDHSFAAQETTDGNYIIAIESSSSDGDIPGNYGEQDLVIMKLDPNGNEIWGKHYGGTLHDHPQFISQTNDGGFIITGGAHSNDGDLANQHHGSTDYFDVWVVKLDANGDWEWGKCLGGSDIDFALNIKQDASNNYILVGQSYSNDDDISGHHGTNSNSDVLVMKLDPSGNILWQKSYGGTDDDIAHRVQFTPDGGYIIICESKSDNGDVTNSHGSWDFWLLKLNANGDLMWQKSYGGSGTDVGRYVGLTNDGGYILTGQTESTDGDVTDNHGDNDCWVVKTDNQGNILWEMTLGGTKDDYGKEIRQLADGSYILGATSYSNNDQVTGHHGLTNSSDFWIVKLTSDGSSALAIQTSAFGPKYCPGDQTAVNYTVSGGAFQNGNVFTAQLSDVTGSFASPTALGTLSATGSGSIPVTIPGSVTGLGYRVRVISSLPPVTGTDNGTALNITCPPPKALNTLSVTSTSATVKWKPVSCANKYFVRYRVTGTLPWSKVGSTLTSTTISNLAPSTKYDWIVSTQCAPGALSKNSDMKNFITLPAKLSTDEEFKMSVNIYPNPASNQVTVAYNLLQDEKVQLRITDMQGRIFYSTDQSSGAGNNVIQINTSQFASGAYMLQLITGTGISNQEVIITR